MSQNLVIVESPAKAKTIKKYLGKNFEVLASYGHVRDLIPKEGAVDTAQNFTMRYAVIDRNAKHVDAIEKALKKASALYLATDPDREGEAISWHLLELLKERGAIKNKVVKRAKFFEITKTEIQKAIAEPEMLSESLVNAQQARRALDYLVGFNLSPLLWKKIMPGLSAGRVQSVALRLICDREAEIRAFQQLEYWTLEVEAKKSAQSFQAKVVELDAQKLEADVAKSRFSLTNETAATQAAERINASAQGKLFVVDVESKPRSRSPQAPFRTSTLQQAAANRLGFSARKTMQLAQKLYEGIDFGEGPIGLITYMRTDSTSLSADAISHLRELIQKRYGVDQVPDKPRTFANKQKNAQEAHEAIRPTSANVSPDRVKDYVDNDLYRLYDLIWKRTVASQMINALYEQVSVELTPGRVRVDNPIAVIRASGSTLIKPGFLAAYETQAQDDEEAEESASRLPALAVGDVVDLSSLVPLQHFTEPPPRFTEASLVRALEERGIGRPSTYASIIETLRGRKYVEDDRRNFMPTDTGKIVSDFLVKFFPSYVDYDFTAHLEDELDEISRGERDWIPVMHEFWAPFKARVLEIEKNVTREEVAQSRALGIDPVSGRPVSVRIGQYGPFVQLGTKDDEEKPKFAGLRAHQKMDTVTLADAMVLFTLPKTLGELPNGDTVSVGIGRFGPYIKHGAKYVSIKADDPYTIELPRALELIEEKKLSDAAKLIKDYGNGITIQNGRFGAYLTDGKRNARIPKDRDPVSLSLAECEALLQDAPLRGTKRFGRKAVTKASAVAKAAPASKKAAASPTSKAKSAATSVKASKATSAKKVVAKPSAKKSPAKRVSKTAAAKKPTAKPKAKPKQ